MSKAVMLSIRPKWAEKIANGEKTIEVRKTRPKLDTPARGGSYYVKGEDWLTACEVAQQSCLTLKDMHDYLHAQTGYGWHITDLRIYDAPKCLLSFGRKGFADASQASSGAENVAIAISARRRVGAMWRRWKMFELKSCPFCGGKVSLVLCDDEGNLHDEAYREQPYSGLGFMLHHAYEENPECPIASYECDGGILGGVHIYDTEEQAAEAWNRRTENG